MKSKLQEPENWLHKTKEFIVTTSILEKMEK